MIDNAQIQIKKLTNDGYVVTIVKDIKPGSQPVIYYKKDETEIIELIKDILKKT